jgi:hypothetical protein
MTFTVDTRGDADLGNEVFVAEFGFKILGRFPGIACRTSSSARSSSRGAVSSPSPHGVSRQFGLLSGA